MARTGKLNARYVATAGVGKHGDGGGLWLRVRKNGSRAWVFRYTWAGRGREMGLGPLDRVSLAEARKLAREKRQLLAGGIDPITAARTERRQAPSFRKCAMAYIRAHRAGWKNTKTPKHWTGSMERHAYPIIGDLPVDRIETDHVMEVLSPIWNEKPEMAGRVRGRIERILSWAAVRGLRSRENPARWRGHLDQLLPSPRKVRAVEHYAAVPYQELPSVLGKIRTMAGIGPQALLFQTLTAARGVEVRGATWDEIDLAGRVWTVPAERMKARKEHRVPLSPEAVALLEALPRFVGTDLVFPSPNGGELSDMAFKRVLVRAEVNAAPHGMRATFKTWAAERTAYAWEVVESCLAHAVGNAVAQAYQRGDLLDRRRKLMEEWARYCLAPRPAGEVVGIGGRR